MATTNQKKFLDQTPIQQFFVGGFQRRFLKVLEPLNPHSILELGCGEGYLLNTLQRHFPTIPILGLDTNQAALTEGHRLFSQLELRLGDIYRIDQPDDSWDVVIASEVLEHLTYPDRALRELGRVSKRYVLLSVPDEPWFRLGNLARGRHLRRLGNHPEHLNLWTPGSFKYFVQQYLSVVSVKRAFPWTIVLAQV